jgi:hypothetical protein
MKKYLGKEMWDDTLYFAEVIPPGQEGEDEPETYIEAFLGYDHPKDRNQAYKLLEDNTFEDTNDFITYQEIFNIFQEGKI